MVFGSHSGMRPPPLDDQGHIYDPNMAGPYEAGPSSRMYVSDPSHPEYDPAIDPNLQLKTVRTAAESIAESHRSEARREARAKAKRKGSILNKLGRGRTLLRRQHPLESSTSRLRPGAARDAADGIAELVQDELGRIRQGYDAGADGTGGEGVGVPFESAQQNTTPEVPNADVSARAETEADREKMEAEGQTPTTGTSTDAAGGAVDLKKKKKSKPAKRRNVYLNIPPSGPDEVRRNGEPSARYPRNKVRTSKYTLVTFLPRFLSEQFRRVANVYFLMLVLLQTSDKFGATVPQIAMLPLVAILGITAIKDGIEDYRRHVLDNQVNNSAVTKLGNWRNVNQPHDARNWLQKLLGIGGSQKVSKGVRKLREKEDAIGLSVVNGQRSRDVNSKQSSFQGGAPVAAVSTARSGRSDSLNSGYTPGLETIASTSEYGGTSPSPFKPDFNRNASTNALLNNESTTEVGVPASRASLPDQEGVIDYTHQTPGTARWERTLWKKLEVGDIVLLRENEQVPADIVLLNSSDPDGNAFVETKNLDGETNLKVRKCLKATVGIQTEEDIEHARFVIDSEPPHANLYSYNALLKFNPPASDGYSQSSRAPSAKQVASRKVEPITANELLLRGCALRNTEWVIGIVVFTGKDTKIMMNGGDTPSKRSKIEKETNVNVAIMFIILLIMCISCAVAGGLVLNQADTSRTFYEPGAADSSSNIINALYIFGSCLVLYQNIVPISLYISIELTKTISAFFIYQDIDMYYEPLDHPCVPKTWGIVDDLGQIEYVFSDKTGTLTQNVMEFKKCSVDGVQYGEGVTEAMLGAMKREGKDTSAFDPDKQLAMLEEQKEQMIATMNRTFKNRYLRPDKLTLISPKLADDLASASGVEQRRNVAMFFRALAICHTALADRNESGDPFAIEYKAQSPDEAALVSAARDVGAVFINKNNQTIDIEVLGSPERLTPLKVLEFNSTRKRMSVIVRDSDGKILLICKGADSVIYQRLHARHPEELKAKTQKDLEDFANAGLRTLCVAYRYLEEGEYLEWARLFDEAAASLTDREDNIDEASEKIEVDLTLIGATALEDKLQAGVPEAIEKLHQAGIKLWILTGDKLQTAIEIGFSCNLLSSSMEIMIISADHEQGARAQLEAACNKIAASGRPVIVRNTQRGPFHRKRQEKRQFDGNEDDVSDKSAFAVVVDGETLKFCLDQNLKPLFLALTTQCETVVCCRVSPAQKALTVRLVKDGIGAMTLSIGDGANDVSMIQEAHVGVGIAGLEGAQASMSADYAIGQFRYLAKLLLVHGHWNAYRIGVLHQVFFYKNLIWTFALLLFQIFCQSNATYLFDYSLVLLYNLVFTSLPVIMLGSLDQDVRAPGLLAFPKTYAAGREGKLYTRTQFWGACVDGVYQSIVCFGLPAAAWYYFPIVTADGLSLDPLTALGTTVGAACIVSANLYCGLMLQNWSVIIWVVIIISNLSYFVWILIYSAPAFGSTFASTAYVLFGTVQFWALIVVCVGVSLLPRYAYIAWESSFRPSYVDLVRQAWIKGELKQRMGLRPGKGGFVSDHTSELENGRKSALGTRSSPELYSDSINHTPALYADKRASAQSNGSSSPQFAGRPPTRNSLMAPGNIGRAESSFSFYDPDKLPSSYTPEPGMKHMPKAGSGFEADGDNDDEIDYYAHQSGARAAGGVPAIHVDTASKFEREDNKRSSTMPYSGGIEPNDMNSRTALAAAASTDSFEQQFQSAFDRRNAGVPVRFDGDETANGQSRSDTAQGIGISESSSSGSLTAGFNPKMSPIDRFHRRFDQAASAVDDETDAFGGVRDGNTPTREHNSGFAANTDMPSRPFARTQDSSISSAVDSEFAGGYHTPVGTASREASESTPFYQ